MFPHSASRLKVFHLSKGDKTFFLLSAFTGFRHLFPFVANLLGAEWGREYTFVLAQYIVVRFLECLPSDAGVSDFDS